MSMSLNSTAGREGMAALYLRLILRERTSLMMRMAARMRKNTTQKTLTPPTSRSSRMVSREIVRSAGSRGLSESPLRMYSHRPR